MIKLFSFFFAWSLNSNGVLDLNVEPVPEDEEAAGSEKKFN
jgi:hypothetical protein